MGAKRLLMNSDQLFLCKFGCKLFISKNWKNFFYPHNIVVGEQKKKKKMIFHNMTVGDGKFFVF